MNEGMKCCFSPESGEVKVKGESLGSKFPVLCPSWNLNVRCCWP